MAITTDEAGALRWDGVSAAERTKITSAAAKSRWANATDAERAAHGKMLADARRKKKRVATKAAK